MMSQAQQTDALHSKRLHERLHAYWDQLRGDLAFPHEPDIDPDSVEDIWQDCFLLHIQSGNTMRYRYLYLGSNLIRLLGIDSTEHDVFERLLELQGEAMTNACWQVEHTLKPLMLDSEFVNHNGILIKYRSSLLPLGDAQHKQVTHMIGSMRWKAF